MRHSNEEKKADCNVTQRGCRPFGTGANCGFAVGASDRVSRVPASNCQHNPAVLLAPPSPVFFQTGTATLQINDSVRTQHVAIHPTVTQMLLERLHHHVRATNVCELSQSRAHSRITKIPIQPQLVKSCTISNPNGITGNEIPTRLQMLFQQVKNRIRHVTPLFPPGTRGVLSKRTLRKTELSTPPTMRYTIVLDKYLPWVSTKRCPDDLAKERLHFQLQRNFPRSNSHRTRSRSRIIKLHHNYSVWPAHLEPAFGALRLCIERFHDTGPHCVRAAIGIQHGDGQTFASVRGFYNHTLARSQHRNDAVRHVVNVARGSMTLRHNRAEQSIWMTMTCCFTDGNLLDFVINPSKTKRLPLIGVLYSPPYNS
mmetsp:Transcript_42738/g.96292  ORF Transcript_42738/g.96292 Transcript_42738/m.96292 type:complete len:369 (+) Transcript_42738:485-1591(+)